MGTEVNHREPGATKAQPKQEELHHKKHIRRASLVSFVTTLSDNLNALIAALPGHLEKRSSFCVLCPFVTFVVNLLAKKQEITDWRRENGTIRAGSVAK